jgi:hypothetical protein
LISLQQYIEESRGFGYDHESLAQLSGKLGVTAAQAKAAIDVVRFLYRSAATEKMSASDATRELHQMAEAMQVPMSGKEEAFVALLTRSHSIDERLQVAAHRRGVVPRLEDVTQVTDIRAVPGIKDEEILTYLPIVTFRFDLRDDADNSEHFLFQADQRVLEYLAEEVDKAVKRVRRVRSAAAGGLVVTTVLDTPPEKAEPAAGAE